MKCYLFTNQVGKRKNIHKKMKVQKRYTKTNLMEKNPPLFLHLFQYLYTLLY